jgi:hypothetical protein
MEALMVMMKEKTKAGMMVEVKDTKRVSELGTKLVELKVALSDK